MKIFKVKTYSILFLMLSIVLVSCGPKVNTNKKTAKDLDSFSSYAFLPNQDTIKTTAFDNRYVNEVVIDEINENMQDQDYRLDRNQPDLLVYYHLMMDEEVAVNATPVYTNYSYYRPGYYVGPYYRNYAYNNYFTIPRIAGTAIEQIPYKEGTIVIDLIDRRTNEIIWRGRANDVVTPNNLEEELRQYVNAIFEAFPK
ncbi:protein of unknown function [Salinimicrobium catena]|uniref:DUF4136 domain-containing protein n=1 Tax=Salinimicrobium catena TaxID=390640 RepID=A0A1H5L637_9FLAO|nr:DUF4136 domain-containing protein [Salinimicrobium catena]SDL05445.1 protein of unknown function [Salinimicrobium catena]SEE71781.1 protein of unknown function [Salinimicrobium catena]